MRNHTSINRPTRLNLLQARHGILPPARAALMALCALGLSACADGVVEDVCGLSGAAVTTDEVGDGAAKADRDGSAFSEAGSVRLMSTDIVAGTLDMIVPNNEDGDVTADLIAAGTFPICIPVGDRSEDTGQVNLVDGSFVTDATRTGNVVILGFAEGILSGRFAFDLVDPNGVETTFTDGVFRVEER